MLTRRRLGLGLVAVIVLALAYSAWQVWRVQHDLVDANEAAQRLRASLESGDEAERRSALGDLRVSAAAAHRSTDGAWWGALTHLPLAGDDVDGIRALARSIDTVSAEGIQPLADSIERLDGIASGGRVDLEAVTSLQQPLSESAAGFRAAHRDVAALDSSGYAGFLKTRFDDYVDDVSGLDRGVRSAASATQVLPDMLGASGPRDYFLVFQNNAEIRATGGLPGSWALVHAEDGRLSIERQGGAAAFPQLADPVTPVTSAEQMVYSDLVGTFFQDANFTPDFAKVAERWKARWEVADPATPLDGVIALDPVALSYLLRATGPVPVGDVTLTADNAVQELLSQPYLTLEPEAQDIFFATAAKSIFDSATGTLASPVEFVRAMSQAADEGRFLLASYDDRVAPALSASRVRGVLDDDDGDAPHVEIGLNDATASKMSYYLRYRARVTSQSCTDDAQSLLGTMTLNQTITAAAAAELPASVTGPGTFGTERGKQTLSLRLYSPTGGSLGPIRIDGAMIDYEPQPLDGREVATLLVQLDGPDDVVVNWSMTGGPGQRGDGSVGVTPSVTSGSKDSSFASSC